MPRRKTFALEAEPKANHTLPPPLWPPGPSQRPGAKDDVTNRPDGDDRADPIRKVEPEEMPSRLRIALNGLVRRPPQDDHRKYGGKRFADERNGGYSEFRPSALADGVLARSLDGDDPDDGPGRRPGEIRTGGDFRRYVDRSTSEEPTPPRGRVYAPWAVEIPRSWSSPTGELSKGAIRLLDDFLDRRRMEEAMGLGMTQQAAGMGTFGVGRSRASVIARETQSAGGSHAWFRRRALELIRSGGTSRGRDTIGSDRADAFFRSMIATERLERWLYRVGYISEVDELRLVDSLKHFDPHEVEAIEYLVQSKVLWRLYPCK
jgi:hypothetical protein